MATVDESAIINKMADIENAISGVEKSYGFAKNPSSLTDSQLPAVLHYQSEFQSDLFAHHNVHRNAFTMQSILFVVARQSRGGVLEFLENETIPYLKKWRAAYQTEANISALLSLGLHRAYTFTGQYGAGGTLLTHNDIEYVGAVFTFNFAEIN